jgi:hypothetical protein
MKRFLYLFCLLLVISPILRAHTSTPLISYLGSAETVCLVQVISIDGNKITFVVTQILKGKPGASLILLPYPGQQKYVPKSEWLLVSCSAGDKRTVGWALDGDCGWIPGTVVRKDNEIYIQDWTLNIPGGPPPTFTKGVPVDTASDGTKGFTLESIKTFLTKNPSKN